MGPSQLVLLLATCLSINSVITSAGLSGHRSGHVSSSKPIVSSNIENYPVPNQNKHFSSGLLTHCDERDETNQSDLLLISTLDGKISALDVSKDGQLKWSKHTSPGPLLSSTISNFEIVKHGQILRVVPSLDGNLYLYDGKTIESVPLTADSLLKSSYKLGDDLVISGGKESRVYGINLLTGQVYYECGISGCPTTTENETNEDMLLVRRITQTVRAIESKSGKEKWYFSVGETQLTVPSENECHNKKVIKDNQKNQSSDVNLKVVVPEGLITALKEETGQSWDYKFESPIVQIWHFKDGQLNLVDLFDQNKLFGFDKQIEFKTFSPSIYIGFHHYQWYVQMDQKLKRKIYQEQGNDLFVITNEDLASKYEIMQIEWKPSEENREEDVDKSKNKLKVVSNTLLTFEFLTSNQENSGYYLIENGESQCSVNDSNERMKNFSRGMGNGKSFIKNEFDEGIPQKVIASLWDYWKEILAITICSSLTFNWLVCIIRSRFFGQNSVHFVSFEILPPTDQQPPPPRRLSSIRNRTISQSSNNSPSPDSPYSSRYLDDFEQIQLLGRGGFGVVFEAKHKIDESHYAIKRICLPMRKEHRDKVMREVKALSKLEHVGIVRYYYTWEERPPAGWQEEMDRQWDDSEASTGHRFTLDKSKLAKDNEVKSTENNLAMGDVHQDSSSSYVKFVNSEGTKEKSDKKSDRKSVDKLKLDLPKNDLNLLFSGQLKTYLYIQMQLCRKDTLKDWLLSNPHERNLNQIYDYFDQITNAVDYVHSMGLMHRDLKPSNIFFSMDGVVKIGDFGLVTATAENEIHTPSDASITFDNNSRTSSSSQKHTDRVGTHLYMSPEQLSGLPYYNKVDIFSMGIIFFELLCPFKTEMERITVLRNARKQKLPSEFQKNHPQESKLLKQLLSLKPEDRPSASDIKEHSLFRDFHPSTEVLRRSRSRTISQSLSVSSDD